jgi:hypothetical protein
LDERLARSTSPSAQSIRAFLNRNLGALSEKHREPLARRIGADWLAAVFAFIVARTLMLLGGSLEVEPPSPSGTRRDFRATFPDGVAHVEATAPLVEGATGATLKRHYPLYDLIAEATPPGWEFAV